MAVIIVDTVEGTEAKRSDGVISHPRAITGLEFDR
jgi:hypothetical protein